MAKKEEMVNEDSMLDSETLAAIKPPRELVINQRGTFVGKHSERLRVFQKSSLVEEAPLHAIKHVLVMSSGVSFSSDAIEECAKRGIPIFFFDYSGKPYATLHSAYLTGTVKTRREQLLAYSDERGLILAKAFAYGKIINQLHLLRYMGKNRIVRSPELALAMRRSTADLEALADEVRFLQGANVDEVRGWLLSIEGRAAQLYWEMVREFVPSEHHWHGRQGQGANDLINSLLNYGYGILYTRVEQAIMLAGLDPFGGFTHTDRPGKPSLVFDLIEEFRQTVVDRTVFALLNLKMDLKKDEEGNLTAETRKLLAGKILERLAEGKERYEGRRQTLQYILYTQARHIATFVRGDLGQDYKPFIASW